MVVSAVLSWMVLMLRRVRILDHNSMNRKGASAVTWLAFCKQ